MRGKGETRRRWRWAGQKQWARTKQKEIVITPNPATPPPKKTVLYAQYVSPDSASDSENGCKDPERPTHEYIEGAQIIVNCWGVLSSLSFYPTRCGCYKRYMQKGHNSSTITIAFPAETLTSLCSSVFIWAKARDPTRGADNYWYLLPAIRMGAKHRETLHYQYV